MYVWRKSFLAAVALLFVAAIYVPYSLLRPLPALQPTARVLKSIPAETATITWPDYGQAAIGASRLGVLETHGPQTAVPSASVAKVMTALAVLQKKPLKLGEQGPILTLSATDTALYSSYVLKNGSVVPVTVGERISEYQVLQAMLLPSANNMADSLAIWAFGSLDNYTAFANQYAKQLGLTSTHIADASGFSAATVTTSSDLVKLGLIAMQTPTLAEIVGQSQADITGAGTVKNVNLLLGQSGIVGIKTGNTDEAGGVYLSAAKTTINGTPVTLVAAVMGAPSLGQAMRSTLPLLASTATNFSVVTPVHAGDSVVSYSTKWDGSVNAVVQHDLHILRWRGRALSIKPVFSAIPSTAPLGTDVGSITALNISSQQSALVLKQTPAQPSWQWRLTHPY